MRTRTAGTAVVVTACVFVASFAPAAVIAGAGTDRQATVAIATVKVKDNYFSPKRLSVNRYATVKWVWSGTDNPHNVTTVSGPERFASSTKYRGGYKHKFRKRGAYELYCTVHPRKMRMKVTVG